MRAKKGLILTEVLVAIGGLLSAIFLLTSIINSADVTGINSRNVMIAKNLALEAIEGVKNLRDTNKLLVPNDKTCWLRTDPSAVDCNTKAALGRSYVVKQNSTGYWTLFGDYSQMLNIDDASGIDAVDKDYLLKISDVGGMLKGYTHDGTLGDSMFYRGVQFNVVEEKFATFEVLVQWMEGVKVKEIRKQVTVFNDL